MFLSKRACAMAPPTSRDSIASMSPPSNRAAWLHPAGTSAFIDLDVNAIEGFGQLGYVARVEAGFVGDDRHVDTLAHVLVFFDHVRGHGLLFWVYSRRALAQKESISQISTTQNSVTLYFCGG